MLNFISKFGIFLYMDSNESPLSPARYELLAGFLIEGHPRSALSMPPYTGDWQMGHISYHYLNETAENIGARSPESPSFPPCFFFIPDVVVFISRNTEVLVIETREPYEPSQILARILNTDAVVPEVPIETHIPVQCVLRKSEYLQRIEKLLEHIQRGDCYEINFCTEFKGNATMAPVPLFQAINRGNPTPYAALYRHGQQYLLCFSPERYLFKAGPAVLSQPIKGTQKRGRDQQEDQQLKECFCRNGKEQAENTMVTDLVRNDLGKVACPGTVQVPRFREIQVFPTVFQMVSSIEARVPASLTFKQLIDATFPIGSMTGAPKHSVLELTERYEPSPRGLYSGTIGYINPDNDFDFNVVIRSIQYDKETGNLGFHAGGAITAQSVPEQEWEEVLVKTAFLRKMFR